MMGVAGVGGSGSGAGSAAGVATALRFVFDFFCVAALLFAFFVSFLFVAVLVDGWGVGGAALVVCGDDVAFLEFTLLFVVAGADGGGMDLCCGVPCT